MAPLLTEEESALDPYALLNLPASATEKDVRKAYRQQSLKYHPDRNPAPEAAVKFREISLSLEILVDVAKRAFVDQKLEGERRRKEKYAELDKKRKAMVDEGPFLMLLLASFGHRTQLIEQALTQREEEAKRAKVDAARRKQQAAEEEEIKEAGKRMVEEAQRRAAAAAAASNPVQDSYAPNEPDVAGPSRTPRTDHHSSSANGATPSFAPEDLTLILQLPSSSFLPSDPSAFQEHLEQRYGPVNHLVLADPPDTEGGQGTKKKKKKGRKAVIEFKKSNWGGCWACWRDHDDVTGSGARKLEEGVKVRWAKGSVPDWIEWADQQGQATHRTTKNNHDANGGPHRGPTNGHDPSFSSNRNGSTTSFDSAPNFASTTMADLLAQHAGRKEQKLREEEFESMTLFKMRQSERDRLAEEIRLAEEAEEA